MSRRVSRIAAAALLALAGVVAPEAASAQSSAPQSGAQQSDAPQSDVLLASPPSAPAGLTEAAPPEGPTLNGAGPWFDTDQGSVRLISAVEAVGDRETLTLGLEFQLQPGWKIYWRTPGDAGYAPQPDWRWSENVAAVDIAWPAPKRFTIFDMETLGYSDEIVLPLTVTPDRPGEPVRLAGVVSYLTCEEICIPYDAPLAIDLAEGPAAGAPPAYLIDRHRAAVPVRQVEPSAAATPGGLAVRSAHVQPAGDRGLQLEVAAASVAPFDDAAMELLVEGPAGTWFDKAQVRLSGDARSARFTVTGGGASVQDLAAAPVTFTLIDGPRAVEASLPVQPAPAPAPAQPEPGLFAAPGAPAEAAATGEGPSLALILLFALLGGLILNLMPCVLPVLSLKLMGVVRKSGADRGHIRLGFLASSAGILVSFLALAAAAIAVKAAGLSVGWGVQFQQPVFLAFMVALLVLFTCNLLGLFEFGLPGFVGERAAAAGGKGGYVGDFMTGAFATLLATPCSAPFLGSAVGFALSRGPGEILAVFLMLGLGLATPYLAVAAFPQTARLLPKPGPWMVWLKRVLALALIGTAFWLLTVLQVTLGTEATLAVGMMAGLAGGVLAARKVQDAKLARFAWPLSAVLAFLTVIYPLTVDRGLASHDRTAGAPPYDGAAAAAAIDWVAFDIPAIADHVAAGRTVFVDVTADWCVTCQWNKKTVMERGRVADWLAGPDVVAMQADWTRPDKTIADYLAGYGRYGIPFNIVYGPDAPGGVVLPELLTEAAVLDAAAEAAGDPALARR